MTPARLGALLLVVGFGSLSMPATIRAQDLTEPSKKQQDAHLKMQALLDEGLIDPKLFPKEMPLAKFLVALPQHLPKDKKFTVRIDKAALGDKYADIVALPTWVPPISNTRTLRSVLEIAFAKSKTKVDYRLDEKEVVITTPERAVYTVAYDIRGVVESPEVARFSSSAFRSADYFQKLVEITRTDVAAFHKADLSQKAALVGKAIVEMTDQDSDKATNMREAFQVLNGTRLVVRAGGARHAMIVLTIQTFLRLSDLNVTSKAKLYEVDEAYWAKLKNAKRFPWEEERIFLDSKADNSLYEGLAKQKRILTGEDVLVNNGQMADLLSRQEIRQCQPSPEQVRMGDKGTQTFTTGIAFGAGFTISPDRRFLRVKLMEKAVELQELKKVRVRDFMLRTVIEEFGNPPKEKEVFADVPILIESTQTQVLEIPDGGTVLVPVQHRPRVLQGKKRWLVLAITSRIIMQEEERRILEGEMQDAIPELVADVLTNPRLKTTREYVGIGGDKRFALVNCDAWTWPKEFRPKVVDFELTPGKVAGKRLLGIRIDQHQWARQDGGIDIRVTLVNAGGNDNGAAPGGCSLRYLARNSDKKWSVELAEP